MLHSVVHGCEGINAAFFMTIRVRTMCLSAAKCKCPRTDIYREGVAAVSLRLRRKICGGYYPSLGCRKLQGYGSIRSVVPDKSQDYGCLHGEENGSGKGRMVRQAD